MKSGKIYLRWDGRLWHPSGREPGENIRYTPKQSDGVFEIAAWLSDDLSCYINSINIWVNNIINIESSLAPDGVFGIGNAHWVFITDDYVFICCGYVEEMKVLMNKEQVLYVLEQYKAILENYNDPHNPPEPMDVEFIAEGQDAFDIYCSLENSHLSPKDLNFLSMVD